MKPRVLFLYTEVADYFLAGIQSLSQVADVWIIRWPVNDEAPFEVNASDQYRINVKSDFKDFGALKDEMERFNPHTVFCSGWIDKTYLRLVKQLNGPVKIISFDNHWNGSLKQRFAAQLARKTILKPFDKAWVPGAPQVEYAKKLGFKDQEIHTGFYCANTELFKKQSEKSRQKKWSQGLPKKFLYVGRYVKHKGIFDLWEAFKEVHQQHPDWELWCVGTGEEFENKVEHEGIRHFGFLQPNELKDMIESTGVFILPSHFEPWGVVVHEYAISGFPLLISRAVGAASTFLKDNENGLSFNAGDVGEIKEAVLQYINTSEQKKIAMSKSSFEMGMSYQTHHWSNEVMSIIGEV